MDKYDLIVIGSGPAGEKGAAQAAYFKKRVALIEREPELGGAAANTGTLPSKTLRETALFLSGFRHRQLEGLDLRGLKEKVTIRDFMAREEVIVQKERTRIQKNLDRHKVTLHKGTASFADPHTIHVQPKDGPAYSIHGDVILIATGSHPFRPSSFDFTDPRVHESDSILRMEGIPAAMLVVGGGVIGCEYACMFAVLGIEVIVVEKRDALIGFLDHEIAATLHEQMQAMGVRFFLSDGVAGVRYDRDVIRVKLQSGAEVGVQAILVSSGRCGNVEGLGLEAVNIEVGERGRIKVNPHFQTNIPHIYAAGDVIGNPALASTAMEQARVAMVHAFKFEYLPGMAKEAVATILPYGLYTIPECSMAGETEDSLKEKKIPYVVGKATYTSNARGQIIGDPAGFLKLLFHRDDMQLLGVHVIGEQATEIVHVGLSALLTNSKADLFIRTCFNYPTLTELYKYATYDALGQKDRLSQR